MRISAIMPGFILIAGILLTGPAKSQDNARQVCGFDEVLKQQMRSTPALRATLDAAERSWVRHSVSLSQTLQRSALATDTVYEIPLVIHVLHTGQSVGSRYNPSDATLRAWIDYLNDVFAAEYSAYLPAGGGGNALPIRFVLAKRDPYCNPTDGINRVDMSGNAKYVNDGIQIDGGSGLTRPQLTSVVQWPTANYYNLYVVNKMEGQDGFCSNCTFTAGFAYLGMSSPTTPFDGAYMLARVAGPGNATLPHEMAHAFGLYHVFESGSKDACPPNDDCLLDNDRVCDTDPSMNLLGTCPAGSDINPCTGQPYGANGVQHNFMNYSQCTNHFTRGQAERMMFMLLNYRQGLINSLGATAPPATAVTSPRAAACNPPGQTFPGNYNIGPANVVLDSIRYFSNGFLPDFPYPENAHYIDHTLSTCGFAVRTSLVKGNPYILSVSVQTQPQYVKVYIDYNNDGILSESELVLNRNSVTSDVTLSATIIAPPDAVENTPLRMRVVADYSPIASSCSQLGYGQTEDFSVTILPTAIVKLELTRFEGRIRENNVAELSWEMDLSDQFLAAFEIEKSSDGQAFTKIASLTPSAGQASYQYTDRLALAEKNLFYRIKLVDLDQSSSYSKTINLASHKTSTSKVSVYPNPVKAKLVVECESAIRVIQVASQNGKVMEKVISAGGDMHRKEIDFARFGAGIYFVTVHLLNGEVITHKVVRP